MAKAEEKIIQALRQAYNEDLKKQSERLEKEILEVLKK